MVSALHSGLKGLGLSLGRVIVLCSWARHFTLTVASKLSGKLDEMLGGYLRLACVAGIQRGGMGEVECEREARSLGARSSL